MAYIKDLTVRSVPCVTFKNYENPKKVATAYFNSALCEEVGINHMKYCELYFDEDTSRIGFHFSSVPGEASRKIQKNKAFPISSFLKANKICYVVGKTYELSKDDSLGVDLFFSCDVSIGNSNPAT